MKRVNLSLKDLTTQFKKHTVAATLQCTGNRRDMFNEVKEVKGLEWAVGKACSIPCCNATRCLLAEGYITSAASLSGACKVLFKHTECLVS